MKQYFKAFTLTSSLRFVIAMLISIPLNVEARRDIVLISHTAFGNPSGCIPSSCIRYFVEEYLQGIRYFDSVIVYQISDGVTTDSIKNIIRNHFYNYDVLPECVLLLGTARRGTNDHIASASTKNFVPGIYKTDYFGYRTLYDNEYASFDTVGVPKHGRGYYPNTIIARIPIISVDDLNSYANKAMYHLQEIIGSPRSWFDDMLFVVGDSDRGEGVPLPGQVNSQMNDLIANEIPVGVETSTIKWSQYPNYSAREIALKTAVNQGKLMVVTMATGANLMNLADMWIRGPDYETAFLAGELANHPRYPLFLSASCGLGQSDTVYNSGTVRSLTEDLLLSGLCGAIQVVGPSGASGQLANSYFSNQFLNVFFEHPNLRSTGQVFVETKIRAMNDPLEANLLDTDKMYNFYGDPSLYLAFESLTTSTYYLRTNFEVEDFYWPYQREAYQKATQIVADSSRLKIANPSNRMMGNRIYKFAGRDTYSSSESPRSFWKLFGFYPPMPINDSTRFMTYYARIPNHPTGEAKISINGKLKSNFFLSDQIHAQYVTDQYGVNLAAKDRTDSVWNDNPRFLAFNLSPWDGDSLEYILIEYDSDFPQDSGWFEAYFDSLAFWPNWGDEPLVGEINMPSSININDTKGAAILAEDQSDQYFRGDTLSYTWWAEVGFFTGSGPNVAYHAPSSPASNVDITCTVKDVGGHTIVKSKLINITNPPPPGQGCPMFYVWNGFEYIRDEVVLTGSEDPTRDQETVVDFCPVSVTPALQRGKYKFRIAENENELSHIDYVELLAVPRNLQLGEELAIKSNGSLVAISNPIAPIYASSPLGYELTKSVKEKDGNIFEYYGPGELTLLYYGLDSLLGFGTALGKSSLDLGGGVSGMSGPGKDPQYKIAGSTDYSFREQERGNYVTVSTVNMDGTLNVEDKIYPRIRSRFLCLTDLSQFLSGRQLGVHIKWEKAFRADQVAFYLSRPIGPRISIPCTKAVDDSGISQLDLVTTTDMRNYQLYPGRFIELEFTPSVPVEGDNQFILKVVGHYETLQDRTDDSNTKDGIVLEQNFPNPFNAGTEISLTLSKPTELTVEVLNVLGQTVRQIHDGYVESGKHSFYWNGKNESFQDVASGIYFYRVIAGAETITKKMLLIK